MSHRNSIEDYSDRLLPMEQDADCTEQSNHPEQSDELKESQKFSKTKVPGRVSGQLTKSKTVAFDLLGSKKLLSTSSKPLNGTLTIEHGFRYTNPTQDPLVYILLYKTEKCSRKPCARTCEKYHSVKERRRSPLQFDYSEQPCPNVKGGAAGRAWGDPTKCSAGDDCEYSHTLLEQMYHPNIYKTGLCNKFSSDPSINQCAWSALCTHAHGPTDRERQIRALAKYKELVANNITSWSVDQLENTLASRRSLDSMVDLQLKVISAEQDEDDDIPLDASPAYDATLNRHAGTVQFLSSFSNVSLPSQGRTSYTSVSTPTASSQKSDFPDTGKERSASTVADKLPIGTKRSSSASVTPKVDRSSLSLNQGVSFGSLPAISMPPVSNGSNISSTNASVDRSKPSNFSRSSSTPIQRPQSVSFSAPAVPVTRTATSTCPVIDRSVYGFEGRSSAGGASDIWGSFAGFRSSWDTNAVEFESRSMVVSSSKFSNLIEDDLKREVEKLNVKVLCPECLSQDRAVLLVPCRHFLCARCAEESLERKECIKCKEECISSFVVRL